MKKRLALVFVLAGIATPTAMASLRPAPVPFPGGPIIVHFDPACLAAGHRALDCIIP